MQTVQIRYVKTHIWPNSPKLHFQVVFNFLLHDLRELVLGFNTGIAAWDTQSGALSWLTRNSPLSTIQGVDLAQACRQSSSRHDGCSWLHQLKKTNLHIYKNQRLEKKQAGKNKRQVRFLNNWNPHEKVNLAFTQLGLSTSIYNREGFGVKSSSENKRLDRCRNLSRDQNFTCFVPLQQTSVTQTILISICFFTFFSD